ncbi:TPA: hypothetical protein N0F65_006889 [Lagenidium giganteum]|uniref:non-specific serine/threonine protein kinase n=1 Tax=Lagenidium giganteum TaxID=4803 RepID=A0AAV2ZJL6_9STRA|nr:TPA: hypothetical protein N0F65_006889 [Lagenidium giganteum]
MVTKSAASSFDMSLPPPAPKIKPSDLRRSHPDKKNQLQSPAAILPLSRCSSTPSPAPVQKSTTISMTGRRGSSTPKSPSCTSEMHVERSSSCLFGRSNPFDTDFCVKELVGEGGFGKIYKCKSNIDGRWYAVKLEEFWFKPQAYFNPSEVREVMMNEALALARLDHENVCRYYNTWIDVYIQMALYDGASLQQWMEQRKCVKIDETSESYCANFFAYFRHRWRDTLCFQMHEREGFQRNLSETTQTSHT